MKNTVWTTVHIPHKFPQFSRPQFTIYRLCAIISQLCLLNVESSRVWIVNILQQYKEDQNLPDGLMNVTALLLKIRSTMWSFDAFLFKLFESWKRVIMTTLLRSTPFLLSRHIPFRCLTPVTRSNDRTVMKRIATTVKFSTVHTDQVKTNLVKDVILYSNKNSRLHRNINIFGLTQLLFWVSLAEYSTYTTKKSHTGDGSEEVPNVKQNSEERKPENGFAQLFVGLGGSMPGWSSQVLFFSQIYFTHFISSYRSPNFRY